MAHGTTNSDKAQPFSQWQEVDVTFPSTANTDLVVEHHLTPAEPNGIHYIPIRKDRAADIYHDVSVARKQWQPSYIVLRSTVASARVRLLLYVPHSTQPSLVF